MAKSGKHREADVPLHGPDAVLFERLPLPALLLDASGGVQRANEQARRLLGLAPADPCRPVSADPALRAILLERLAMPDRARLHEAMAGPQAGERHIEGLSLQPEGAASCCAWMPGCSSCPSRTAPRPACWCSCWTARASSRRTGGTA